MPERPFPAHIRIRPDRQSRAWYGWRIDGAASCARGIRLQLPAPSPTGAVWVATRTPNGLRWLVPRQVHRGAEVDIAVPAGTCVIASAPTTESKQRLSEAFHVGRGHRSIVVIACQHPGEDGAERVARDMAERLEQAPLPGAVIDIVPLVNREGRLLGLTRETAAGVDLNRCWHKMPADCGLSRLRQCLAVADFVLDIHADEHADRPYTVAPAPCPVAVLARVVAFREGFAAHLAHATRRPRPIGAGEDDPGILVNWLAKCGVPAVMLEVPMQLARARRSADFQSVRHRERRLAVAAIAGLEAVLKADGVDREAPR